MTVWNNIMEAVATAMGGDDAATYVSTRQDIKFLFMTFEDSTPGDVILMLIMAGVIAAGIFALRGTIMELVGSLLKFLFFVIGVPIAIYGVGVATFEEQAALVPVSLIILAYWIILAMSSGSRRRRPRREELEEERPETRSARRHRRRNAA